MFMDACDFHRYIKKALDAYLANDPVKTDVTQLIISKLRVLASD